MEKKNWQDWTANYEDPTTDLSQRLSLVKQQISAALPSEEPESFSVLSICAGDGRDILDTLRNYPHKEKVSTHLIEINEALARSAARAAFKLALSNVEVITGDASNANNYESAVPADLILLCGVFGNISNEDTARVVRYLPHVISEQGKVIWTRDKRDAEAMSVINHEFSEAGFNEVVLTTSDEHKYAVGTHQFEGTPLPNDANASLFTFIR